MSGLLEHKKMLVTGAATGIGRAIALAAAREGARVIVGDLDGAGAEETVAQIHERGSTARAMQVDVGDYPAVQNMAAKLGQEGLPEVLVNNAATWNIKPFLETGPEDWQHDLRVTLLGALICCRVFLPAMIERGSGVIVNIASDAGRVGEPSWSVYSAAKGGVIAFTKALAKEVGRSGIRVNAVSPGTTRTEKFKAFVDEHRQEKTARHYPLGRLGEPREVAEAVIFFASDRSSFITGQVLSVSGGYSMSG